jgi:5-methylcytosine-specific restriction endonuclease McrA
MKVCKCCHQEKDFSEFAISRPKKSGGFTYATKCRKCHYETYKDYYSQVQKERIKKKRKTIPDGRTGRPGPRPQRVFYRTCKLCGKVKSIDDCVGTRNICKTCGPAYYADHHQKHKAYYRRKSRQRQAMLASIPGSHTDEQWEAVKSQYNHTCLKCGKPEPEIKLTRDHVVPIIKGGTDYIDNIQPLCGVCNSSKNDKHVDYRSQILVLK